MRCSRRPRRSWRAFPAYPRRSRAASTRSCTKLVAGPVAGWAVLVVAEAVVGHQALGDDPVLGEEGERALDERGYRLGFLVVVELDVGEPRVVVDDRVRVVVADPRLWAHPAMAGVRAV